MVMNRLQCRFSSLPAVPQVHKACPRHQSSGAGWAVHPVCAAAADPVWHTPQVCARGAWRPGPLRGRVHPCCTCCVQSMPTPGPLQQKRSHAALLGVARPGKRLHRGPPLAPGACSKFFLLEYERGCRIIITTANAICEWGRARVGRTCWQGQPAQRKRSFSCMAWARADAGT